MKALIVDSEELFRLSVKEVATVAANPSRIFEASSEREFLALTASEEKLGLIIIHTATLGREGQDCVRIAKRLYPNAAVVVIDDKPQALDTAKFGIGLTRVMRTCTVVQMISAIRRALGLSLDGYSRQAPKPDIRAVLTETQDRETEAVDLTRLSFRQKQILAMAADGLPNKEIAARLEIAEGTVKAHMHAIFKVMGVSNRTQAVIRFGGLGQAAPSGMVSAEAF